MKLQIVPVFQKDAFEFVRKWHRHRKPPVGSLFQIGASLVGNKKQLCGVSICGRPVAPKTNFEEVIEVTRLCTNGTKNACSILYAASARIAREMGYKKIQTFILSSEPGTSLIASGWFCEEKNASTKIWNSSGDRIRSNKLVDMYGEEIEKYPDEPKDRWVKYLK